MEKWTVEQELAMETTDRNVLVSASAGSGKTSVMIERIIRLVLSGRADVRHILVVTFVSTAAAEMKKKLYDALRKKIAVGASEEETARLRQQLDHLDIASISTLHSFSADILREYFYEAELDPQFNIISGQDVEVLKGEALDDTIEHFIEADDPAFIELIEMFTRRRKDTAYRELILSVYEFLSAQRDPDRYLTDVISKGYRNVAGVLEYVNSYIALICSGHCAALTETVSELHAVKLPAHAEVLSALLADLTPVSAENDWEKNMAALEAVQKCGVPRKPKNADFMQEAAVERYSEVRRKATDFVKEMRGSFGTAAAARAEETAPGVCARIDKLAESVRYFTDAFTAAKRAKNAVDFSDLEHLALKVFASEQILAGIRAKYRYVFVDEYQDINDVQEAILSAVSRTDNLFMVGDVKQSIYGFRLCDPTIFTEKYYRYRNFGGGLSVPLNRNFRSGGGVLDFANAVFARLFRRDFGGTEYRTDSMLQCGCPYETVSDLAGADVRIVKAVRADKPKLINAFPYDMDDLPEDNGAEDYALLEGEMIARIIEEYKGKNIYLPKTGRVKQIEYGDIVILTRSYSDYVRRMQKHLLSCGIPVRSAAGETAGTEVRLLIDLLNVIDNPLSDVPLIAVMRSVFGGFTDVELAALRTGMEEEGQERRFYHECVLCAAEKNGTPAERKAASFLAALRRYRLILSSSGIARTLERAICESGYDMYLLSGRNGREKYLRVNSYLNQLENSELGYSLSGYLKQINDTGSLTLGDTTVAEAEGVRLMSIHKAKGLEFPVVILAGAGQRFNQTDLNDAVLLDKSFGMAIDSYDLTDRTKCQTLTKEALRLKKRREMLEEELRVLYVALTRAQNHIVVTGKCDPDTWNGNVTLPSLLSCRSYLDFLSKELISQLSVPDGGYRFTVYPAFGLTPRAGDVERKTADIAVTAQTRAAAAEFEQVMYYEYPYASAARQKQKLTVTQAGERARFASDEQTPPAEVIFSESAAEKGVSYHAVLEHADLLDTSIAAISHTIDTLVTRGVIKNAALISPQLIKECLDSPLMDLARKNKAYREKTFMLYLSPRELYGGESAERVLVQGKIDMLIVTERGAIVVDFKSASVVSAKAARARYGRQLDLYALAVEKVLRLPVIEKVIYSIEGRRSLNV